MSFRITTNGVFRTYRTNLSKSQKSLYDTMERVQTGRAFNSYAEDPAAASRAFQMRRDFWRTNNQVDNSNYLISKYQTGWNAIGYICDGDAGNGFYGLNGIRESLRAVNDPTGNGRQPLGQEMLTEAESILKLMNTQYGEEFVFAGADGLNVPFTSEGGRVFYRGIDVDTPIPDTAYYELERQFTNPNTGEVDEAGLATAREAAIDAYMEKYADLPVTDANGEETTLGELVIDADGSDPDKPEYRNYLMVSGMYDQGSRLKEMTEDAMYVDIGLGMKEDANGNVIPSSAYNGALVGIQFLGFGLDEDGDPKNIISLLNEMGTLLRRCDQETGAFAEGDQDRAFELMDKISKSVDGVIERHVEMDANAKYLRTNLEQLESSLGTLNEQIMNIESEDPAMSISEMSWAQYTYNAALRIGNQILSQSLLDYMN